MKKSTIILVAALFVLSMVSLGHAKYVKGFKVVDVAENQVTIQKGNDDPVAVKVKKVKYKIGEEVRYDAEKLKIRPSKLRKAYGGC